MIKGAITESAYEVLGMKQGKKKNGWFDSDCEKAVRETNEAHNKYIQRRTRERREDKEKSYDKLCRVRKRRYESELTLKMEDNFKENETRKAFKYIQGIREGYKP